MNIFKAFKDNVLGTTGQDASYNERYRNLDGSPYGSTRLCRIILTPSMAGTALYTGAIEYSKSLMNPAIAVHPVQIGLGVLATYAMNRLLLKRVSGDQVIDTKGETGDLSASVGVAERYIYIANGALALSIAFNLSHWHMIGNPLWANGVANAYKNYKLRHGHWTIVEPPAPRVRKPKVVKAKAARGKLQPAFG